MKDKWSTWVKARGDGNSGGGGGNYSTQENEWFEIITTIEDRKRQTGPWTKVDTMGFNPVEVRGINWVGNEN